MECVKKICLDRVIQKEIGYCGPATVSMMLSSYHLNVSQEKLMDSIGIPEDKRINGTRIDQLANSVSELAEGFALLAKYNSSLSDIKTITEESLLPIGIEWQGSFLEPNGHVYNEGHYSLILGSNFTTMCLQIIDPDSRSTFINGYITFDELLKRWWDINTIPFHKNGTTITKEIYNEKLTFIIVPKKSIAAFQSLGYRPATLGFMIDNGKENNRFFVEAEDKKYE